MIYSVRYLFILIKRTNVRVSAVLYISAAKGKK